MKKSRLTVALCLGSLALAGCSSTPSSTGGEQGNAQTPIYGYLTEHSSGYEFSRFTLSRDDVRGDLPWVRLADNQPMWNTQPPKACGESSTMRPDWCSQDNPALFMEAEVDGSALGGTAAVATLTMGLSLLGGLPMQPEFQEGDFLDAVDEAKGRIPNYDGTIDKISRRLDLSQSQAYKDYLAKPLPEVNYNVIDQMPKLGDGKSLLNAMSDVYVSSFPEITIKQKSPMAALSDLGEFQSLAKMLDALPTPDDAILTYSAECNFTNSVLRMDFNCPSDIPAYLDEVTVDFFVEGAIVQEAVFPVIDKQSRSNLTLSHYPARLNPWVIQNDGHLPVSLRSMTVELGYRDARIDLRSRGIVMPGQQAEFDIDDGSYKKILSSLRYSEGTMNRRTAWKVVVQYIPQGFNDPKMAVFYGSNNTKELVEMAVAVRNLKGDQSNNQLNALLNAE